MDHQEILKLAHGHPVFLAGAHLTLSHACAASGISIIDLLRASVFLVLAHLGMGSERSMTVCYVA